MSPHLAEISAAVEKMKADGYDPFPEVSPGRRPVGHRVIIQMMQVADSITVTRTDGSHAKLYKADNTKDLEEYDTVVAKVISLGAGCYSDRETGKPWATGAWCKIGDLVEVPKYGGHQFKRKTNVGLDVRFRVINDDNVMAVLEDIPAK